MGELVKNGLNKKVLSEQIKEKLIEDIINKKYKPGDRIVESALAKTYGVSQAPVREAIKELSSMGMLEVRPYKGTIVKEYTKKEIEEFVVVRSNLESLAAELAAKRITEKEIVKLQEMINEMVKSALKGDYEERSRINSTFHQEIIEASDNKILIDIINNLRLKNWSQMTSMHTSMDQVVMAQRHQEILDALKNHDEVRASKAIRRHVKESFESFTADIIIP